MEEERHIAIIMDGNRRFAKKLMLSSWKGHEFGSNKIREVLGWCKEAGFSIATLYSFSMQNFNRPRAEFEFLMDLFEKEFSGIANPEHDVHKNKIKVNVIGRRELLPKNVQEAIRKAEEATKGYNDFILNFAIAYGGQEEITDAVVELARRAAVGLIKPELITQDTIRHLLYTNGLPYPDLIVRTGGEKRSSNFLVWQSAYSEFAYIDKLWPEITKEDFMDAVKDFKSRERRFGK